MVLLLVVEVEVVLLPLIKMVVMVDQTMVVVEEVLLQELPQGQEMGMEMMVVQVLQVAHQDMDLVLVVVLAGLVVLDLILGKQQLLEVLEHQIVF